MKKKIKSKVKKPTVAVGTMAKGEAKKSLLLKKKQLEKKTF